MSLLIAINRRSRSRTFLTVVTIAAKVSWLVDDGRSLYEIPQQPTVASSNCQQHRPEAGASSSLSQQQPVAAASSGS